MSKINKKAFAILTKDEQASLALQQVSGKSTWQAGEIMKKSHYKYLEINQRAKRFFELFQLHYDQFDDLIPVQMEMDELFIKYLRFTIEKRMTVKAAALATNDPRMMVKKTRDEYLTKCVKKLSISMSAFAPAMYKLIMEFDRYNNFRVLPSEVQEPSAFKRRNKTRFKKHLLTSLGLEPYTLDRLSELFKYRKSHKKEGYIVLCTSKGGYEPTIVKIGVTDESIKVLSSISIYIFHSYDTAKDYKELVYNYTSLVANSPREGLKFWPQYRAIIKEAANFSDLNNIIPSRKHVITSLRLMDESAHRKRADQRLNQSLR